MPELTSSHAVWYDSSTSSRYDSQIYSTDTTKAFVKTIFSSETGAAEGTVLPVKPLETVSTAVFSSETSTATGTAMPVTLQQTATTASFTSERGQVEGRVLPKAEQRTVSDLEPEATFGERQRELVIGSARTILTKISVTETVDDPKLNLVNLLGTGQDDRKAATYPSDLDIDISSGNRKATMSMEKDTTVIGSPSWDGVMDLPRFVEHSSPFGDVDSAIYVGLDGERLEFDKPVRIVFLGGAGYAVAFEMGGQHTMIDALCRADDAGVVEAQLEGAGECRIEVGSDLAVWTYHLTRFYTFILSTSVEPTEPVAPEPAQIRRGGGGGGGGGGGSVTGAAAEGRVAPVYIRSVSWDCQAGTVAVEAGPDDEGLAVSVLSKTLGFNMAEASDAQVQSGHRMFVAPMHAEDDFIQVKVLSVGGRDFTQAVEQLNLDSCAGTKTFQAAQAAKPAVEQTLTAPVPVPVQADAPTPEQVVAPESVPEQASPEPVREPAVPPPAAPAAPVEPSPEPDPCGPGTEKGADGTCRIAGGADGGGCLVATAAHGTELAVQVQRLREIRETVASTGSGAAFMDAFNHVYYSFSPAVADAERQNPALREVVRAALTPMLATLHVMDFADSEAGVVALGILAVSMNLGIYGSPLVAAVVIRALTKTRPARG